MNFNQLETHTTNDDVEYWVSKMDFDEGDDGGSRVDYVSYLIASFLSQMMFLLLQ